MNYWLICLPREDMTHCVELGTFGLGRKQTIANVRASDLVACVVTREIPWKVIALGEAVSDYYVDDKTIFRKTGTYYDRFDFKAARLRPEPSFAELVGKMGFITKPENWPVYFRTGIVKLSSADWQSIEEAARAIAGSR